MPARSAFAGLKLSEQVTEAAPKAKLDQRLFETTTKVRPPAARAEPQKPVPAQSATPPPQAGIPPGQSSLEKARRLLPATLTVRFDLAERPSYKRSFMLTQKEDEALEDLKLEISRSTDSKVSKEQLVRLSVHLMVEDYAANREHSHASRRLRANAR